MSDVQSWTSEKPAAEDDRGRQAEVEDLEEDDEEEDVEQAEQERRQRHPGGQAEVSSEALAFHLPRYGP